MSSIAELLTRAVKFHQAGNFLAAEGLYHQVLRIDPRQIDALHFLGVVAGQTGRLELAIEHLQAAVARQPQNATFLANLGLAYLKNGQPAEAIIHYQKAHRFQPGNVETHLYLGIALEQVGRLEEAAANLRQALRLQPDFAEAHHNLGKVLRSVNRIAEAEASYREALRCKPDLAEANNNLSNLLKMLGRLDEAVACCEQAIKLRPDMAAPFNNLGNAFAEQGKLDEAIANYREAMRLEPTYSGAFSNLLLCLNYHPDLKSETILTEHRRWDEHYRLPRAGAALHQNERSPDRRLRVGYVSPDLRNHPVAGFVEPILANHDPDRVEVFCYAQAVVGDAITAQFQKLVPNWRSISNLEDEAVAKLIRRDQIDILVDLSGHTAFSRVQVFTHKSAPVQVTYLGYPNTTGLTAMDYCLTDAVVDPPDEASCFTEQLVRLPGSFCCYYRPKDRPSEGPLPADRNGRITFGSLHSLVKLNARVLDLWSAILRAVPSASLLIFRHTLQGSVRDRLIQHFAERGIEQARLDLRHVMPPGQDHWNVYQEIDISLDVFPWSGHTTACESLWMGVPVVTLHGDRHAGRMVASVLTRLGMTDWIATTPDEYVDLSFRAANDWDRLRALRFSSRERMRVSPLCDGRRFTRELEEVYRAMWRTWCERGGKDKERS